MQFKVLLIPLMKYQHIMIHNVLLLKYELKLLLVKLFMWVDLIFIFNEALLQMILLLLSVFVKKYSTLF